MQVINNSYENIMVEYWNCTSILAKGRTFESDENEWVVAITTILESIGIMSKKKKRAVLLIQNNENAFDYIIRTIPHKYTYTHTISHAQTHTISWIIIINVVFINEMNQLTFCGMWKYTRSDRQTVRVYSMYGLTAPFWFLPYQQFNPYKSFFFLYELVSDMQTSTFRRNTDIYLSSGAIEGFPWIFDSIWQTAK